MQGMLLEAHLAHLSRRTCVFCHSPPGLCPPTLSRRLILCFLSYVFQNYTWDTIEGDFSYYKDNRIPARVPLTALLSGMPHPFHRTHLRTQFLFSIQAPLLGIHFRHHPAARPRSPSNSSRKYARTRPSSIRTRSKTHYMRHLPRPCSRHGSTSSSGRQIGVWR